MATVKAFLRVYKKKAEKSTIRFRLSDGRAIQLFHKSNLEVNPTFWDAEKESIKAKVIYKEVERAKFNKAIADRKDLISQVYNSQTIKAGLTSEWLEMSIDKVLHPEKYEPIEVKPCTVFEYFESYLSTIHSRKVVSTGRLLAVNTTRKFPSTLKHLKVFAKIKRKNDFEFDQINEKFYIEFVDYLQKSIVAVDKKGSPILNEDSSPKLLKNEFTQNSVGKHVKILKTILAEAAKDGINKSTTYNQFAVYTEDSDAVYLNESELLQLKNTDFSKNLPLDRVRDWFLLLAWSGCRFSDLGKIGKTDIKDGFITFRQQKTNSKVTIPLHPIVSEILLKYNYEIPEPITNQKFNDYIKIVAEKAGIISPEVLTRTVGGVLTSVSMQKFELITSHTGRRSFCTNMYKRGLPTLMIMSISGHKSEKSFLRYIRVKQEEHAELMAKAWATMYK
ncbi:MAG: phage integrase SAM-like domain-containing protein [Paludibacter sp.]